MKHKISSALILCALVFSVSASASAQTYRTQRGGTVTVRQNGTRVVRQTNGRVVRQRPNGRTVVTLPNGRRVVRSARSRQYYPQVNRGTRYGNRRYYRR